jgi:CRP-like cAMP-binding protein
MKESDLDTMLAVSPLFRDCSQQDLHIMARHLAFRTAHYPKGALLFTEGNCVSEIGFVLEGSVQLEHNDLGGNKNILGIVTSGNIFAEAYACLPREPLMINVVACEECEILFINAQNLFVPCAECSGQMQVLQNLVRISAQKNVQLSKRSMHTAPKTIRGRLLSYFAEQSAVQNSTHLVLPFDRQQLADYLNLDRSALSKELGKMRDEGLLDYHKNEFWLKNGF